MDAELRPDAWDDYIGQEEMKKRLRVSIVSALAGGRALGHVLLYGPPGMGKTSLSGLIAAEMMEDFTPKVCPVPDKMIHGLLMEVGGVILLDEIHRLSKKQQEGLLPVLGEHAIQFPNGTFQSIPGSFTIIGATTNLSDVIKPLRERFIHKPRFRSYSDEEMAVIFTGMARKLGMDVPPADAMALGKASAGVPRQARNLALAARDLHSTDPATVLEFTNITPDGLTEDHLRYLEALSRLGGVIGVDILSNYLNLPKDVLFDLESLLINKGCIEYTPKGRSLLLGGLNTLDRYENRD